MELLKSLAFNNQNNIKMKTLNLALILTLLTLSGFGQKLPVPYDAN